MRAMRTHEFGPHRPNFEDVASTSPGMRHSCEARKLLRELDAELAAASEHAGRSLVWTPQERAVLELIADQTDRKVELSGEYAATCDTVGRVKLSAELRLLEGSLARLLRQVKFDVPAVPVREPSHVVSARASRAAKARWYPNATG